MAPFTAEAEFYAGGRRVEDERNEFDVGRGGLGEQ